MPRTSDTITENTEEAEAIFMQKDTAAAGETIKGGSMHQKLFDLDSGIIPDKNMRERVESIER